MLCKNIYVMEFFGLGQRLQDVIGIFGKFSSFPLLSVFLQCSVNTFTKVFTVKRVPLRFREMINPCFITGQCPFVFLSGAWLSYPDLKYKDGNSQEVKWMYVTDRNSFWVRKVRPAQKCFKPDSSEQSSGSIEIYEKMSPLLSAPMTSTNTFLMCLWIQSLVSILTKYNMMFIR